MDYNTNDKDLEKSRIDNSRLWVAARTRQDVSAQLLKTGAGWMLFTYFTNFVKLPSSGKIPKIQFKVEAELELVRNTPTELQKLNKFGSF